MKLRELVDVAERELAIRRAVYARKVAEGRMGGASAEYQIAAMNEISAALRKIADRYESLADFLDPKEVA